MSKKKNGVKISDMGSMGKMDDGPRGKAADPDGPRIDTDKGKDGGMDDHEAEMAMNDMMRVHEHMQNDGLMKRVGKKVGRKHKSIQSLKDTYNEKFGRAAMESGEGKDE